MKVRRRRSLRRRLPGREDLARLLREAEAGDLVLAWKQDLLGRDTIDGVGTIRELVKFDRCRLYTTESGTVPLKFDTATDTGMVMLRGGYDRDGGEQ